MRRVGPGCVGGCLVGGRPRLLPCGQAAAPVVPPGAQRAADRRAFQQILCGFQAAQQAVFADAGIERSQKILQGEQCSGKQLVAVGASGAEGRQHGFDLGVGASGVPGAVGLPGPEAL